MSLETNIKNFKKHLGSAIEAINNAAREYADAIHKFGSTAHSRFADEFPHVTENTWAKLLAIGNGDANPNVMFFSDKFASQIMRMPKQTQDEVLNGDSFDVFNPATRKVERVNYGSIKPRHERLIFDDNRMRVRSVEDQKNYADLLAHARKNTNAPYVVNGDNLEVFQACVIGKNQVREIADALGV